MMQYLVILLDDTSVSYCYADNPRVGRRLINLDDLRAGILYAMKENLMIQFVHPDYELPQEYLDIIDTIDHHDIVPWPKKGDVTVLDCGDAIHCGSAAEVAVLRLTKAELFSCEEQIATLLMQVQRLNIVVTDVETFTDGDLKTYAGLLGRLAEVETQCVASLPQLNLLTDRMMLTSPNHCNAGVENITLAPDGRFYLCPAFYYSRDGNVGDLASGPSIPNAQLLRLDHAPLCRRCDALHCRRCVWLNRRATLEVNTPGHMQCAVAHTKLEASRQLLERLRTHGEFMPEVKIKQLNYIDPFEVRKEW